MAKIFFADDDETIQKLLKRALLGWNHEVVGMATNLPEALAEARLAEEKGVQVAIIDGNLGSGALGTGDGEAVSALLRELAPNVRIIAHTASPDGNYGHVFIMKPGSPQEMKAGIEKALAMSSKT